MRPKIKVYADAAQDRTNHGGHGEHGEEEEEREREETA